MRRSFSCAVLLVVGIGCGGRSAPLSPSTSETDAGPPPSPCDLDVLFMVDDSASMAEEQAALADALITLLEGLDSGDADGDGDRDFPVPASVQLGVVSSDLGAAPAEVPTCERPLGGNGRLATDGADELGFCSPEYPTFLTFSPGLIGNNPSAVAQQLACLTTRGTSGCGYEQPLEAALYALTPSSSSLRFFDLDARADRAAGHGDGANAGFARPDSILAIFIVTDEDDCSVEDRDLFEPLSTTYPSTLNLRCNLHRDALRPVSRYVDGFRALRAAHPERLVVMSVAGVPVDATADPSRFDAGALLDDPRMAERVALGSDTRLVPVCEGLVLGDAFPGRRYVELTGGLEEQGILQSICQPDLTRPVATLLDRVGQITRAGCE